MNKPKFSVALIARNEEHTLPRMIESLKEYQERGGDIWVLDTGSTDNTAKVARDLGCNVEEVGDKFKINIDKELADKINEKFVVENEEPVVNEGESLFDFASARNYIADFPTHDMIATPDCDEIYTKFDIDKVNEVIDSGVDQLEYEFVFSHDENNNPVIKFKHCKFYNRTKLKWVGVIHEVLKGQASRQYLGEDIIKLEHYQNEQTNRSGYLKGLAIDCYNNPNNDRNSHYFAREMFYLGRYKSSIKEFKNHISMGGWGTEASQSMLYIGDCYKALGDFDEMLKWYAKSVEKEARREPLMRLAEYYFKKEMYPQVILYVEAALSITQLPFYSNHQPYYENVPHELLYIAYWWTGKKDKSKEHYLKALAWKPNHPRYIQDGIFFGMSDNPEKEKAELLDGYMEKIKKGENFTFVKRGDGEEFCMNGETGVNCDNHPYSEELGNALKESFDFLEDKADIYKFEDQTRVNLLFHRKDNDLEKVKAFWMTVKESLRRKIFVGPERLKEVCDLLDTEFVEVPLVNAFEQTKDMDLNPQDGDIFIFSCGMPAKVLLAKTLKQNPNITCIDAGSAFDPIFVGNTRTEQVDQETLRRLYLLSPLPKISFVLPTLGREEGLKRCLDSISALNYPQDLVEVIVKQDNFENRTGVPKLVKQGVEESTGDWVVFAADDIEFTKDSIMNALSEGSQGYVAFNTGKVYEDEGNINEHFMIRKDIIKEIGEIFDTDFWHVGVDNLLLAKIRKLGIFKRSDKAVVKHYHFAQGSDYDKTYEVAWSHVEEDRALLAKKLLEI